VRLPSAIVFVNSAYRSRLARNEVVMPPPTEDLSGGAPFQVRPKGDKPRVGFCGWADYPSVFVRLKTAIKDLGHLLGGDPARRRGLWWRRKALTFLARDTRVTTDFVVRRTHSGVGATLSADVEALRREYRENVLRNDFTLCTKGDGNYSYRFYETLSLGRLPLFVDTDTPLPLEDVVRYDDFLVRVDGRRLAEIGAVVSAAWASWSDGEFAERQRRAREAFERHLRLDAFLRFALRREFLDPRAAR
jgi:hypothetical protein